MPNTVEVCFSPTLYPYKLTEDNFLVVVVDILRATTSITAAFEHGVRDIIPVAGIEKAREYKQMGFFVACERNGEVLDFADVGNSPSDFLVDDFKDKTVVFSTTNGTQAIKLASDADEIVAGSFGNLDTLAQWISSRDKHVVILCAAWKNLFNLEDSVYAGALSELLLAAGDFVTECDSVKASIDLWKKAKSDLQSYLAKSSHRNRLKHLVSDIDFKYTVTLNSNRVVPYLIEDRLVNLNA